MKLLHLADLHIGKVILEQSLLEDQEYMLKRIIEKIKEEKIEAVLIAGDIYDKAIPSSDAVNLLNDFLNTLVTILKLQVFIISGNHDSKERLNFGSEILDKEGLHICTTYNGTLKKYVLYDTYGPINIYLLPYIKPIDIKPFFDSEIHSYDEAIEKIIEKEEINSKERNIILSHQFVTYNEIEPERSESETLYLGGTENVDVSHYEPFDYVALGHIHRPQKIGRETARYAGTMLKYSFSEVMHNKILTILDMREKNNLNIKFIPLVPLRDMRQIEGPIEQLIKKENYQKTNTLDYIQVIITNEEPIYDAIGQIKTIYPNTLKLLHKNSNSELDLSAEGIMIENIKSKDEFTLFLEFYESQNGKAMNEEKNMIIKEIISEAKKVENETNKT